MFRANRSWKLEDSEAHPDSGTAVAETLVFSKQVPASIFWRQRGVNAPIQMVFRAKAYRSAFYREAMGDYLKAVTGNSSTPTRVASGHAVQVGGNAHVVGFVGHNYLMNMEFPVAEGEPAEVKGTFVLACLSEPYFSPYLSKPGIVRFLMTQSLMAPEAYTVEAILEGLSFGEDGQRIRERAVVAYARFQKTSLKAAQTVFVRVR